MPRKNRNFQLIYWLFFIVVIGDALTGYIQSSYLNQYVSLPAVGLIFGVASLIALLIALFYHRLIVKFSNYNLTIILFLIATLANFCLYTSQSGPAVITAFIIRYVCFIFIATSFDLFLERISTDQHTGSIRTIFMTWGNLAWLASPLLMSWIVGSNNNYPAIYLVGSLLLLVALFLTIYKRQELNQPTVYKANNLIKSLKLIWQKRDLRLIWRSAIILNFFYFIVSIYVPIHLYQTIGLSWASLGIIFTIMLLPFVLLEIPAGLIADKYLGEKEMLMAGHFIMALAMALIFLTTTDNLLAWGALLFFSRIGAALAEAMQETYFYKQVTVKDVGLINLFRRSTSLGWLLGATLTFILLSFISPPHIFMILATILLINAFSLHNLVDTK
ncbi:MAG: MFS transporter [bacterium]